jgi:fermentation-respiration switch protein FrsA (DUF1100 family)
VSDLRRNKRVIGFVLGLVAVALLAVLALLGLSWLLAYWYLHPLTRTTGHTPANLDLVYEEIEFVTVDGLTLRGWYIPGWNGATVIFCHGFARDRSELLPEAGWLLKEGYGALLFDFRAQGASGGAHIGLGYLEALDVQAAVDFVSSRSPQERVGVLGYSMGAMAAIRAAATDTRIGAVIAVSPFASTRDLANQRLRGVPFLAPLVVWWSERMTGLRPDDLRPLDDVAVLSPRPILILQAGADEMVPRDSGQRLYEAAGEPKELWSAPGVAHVDFRQASPETYKQRVTGFFDQHLLLSE